MLPESLKMNGRGGGGGGGGGEKIYLKKERMMDQMGCGKQLIQITNQD